ncbi:MAG: DMT family transporter [Arenicellales bacterium]|mgnify:FL=1|jgi:drug/metabolite transporter (DMT)-like permease|nr:DMT family transporter [Arenicellales bacterium]
MTPIHPTPTPTDYFKLILIGAAWGSSFLAIKVIVEEVSPLMLVALRTWIGALCVAGLLVTKPIVFPRTMAVWRRIVFIGLVGTGLPFFLISWGETRVDSGLAAMAMSVGPVFAVLLSHITAYDGRPLGGKLLGVFCGLTGVAILSFESLTQHSFGNLIALLATLAAAICYVLGGESTRKITGASAEFVTTASLCIAAMMTTTLLFALESPDFESVTRQSWMLIIYLGAVSTGLALLIRFNLIKSAGLAFASYVGYLVPSFGFIFGVLILSEALSAGRLLALVFILLGLYLLQRQKRERSTR